MTKLKKLPPLHEAQKEEIWNMHMCGNSVRVIASIMGATVQEVSEVLNERN